MSNLKIRKKIFQKIAEISVPVTPPTPAAIAPPTDWMASSAYPIQSAFNPISIGLINQLCEILHTALHYATGGKINFQTLKGLNFTMDASGMPSPDQKNLVNLSKLVYQNILIKTKKVSPEEIDLIVNKLSHSPELNNLSSISPAGPIGQKIPGNLKTNILNILNYFKNANPTQAT